MSTIDDLFKKPYLPGDKRKPEGLHEQGKTHKLLKLYEDSDTKSNRQTIHEDEQEGNTALVPESQSFDESVEDEEDEGGRFFGGGITSETAGALDFVDERDKTDPMKLEKIDSAWLRKRSLTFEKTISKNAELRAKYEETPEKFMASEADLEAEIKALSVLCEHPNLYEDFAKLGCVSSLVSLLSHENTDIAIDAIEIINELTDDDVKAEQTEWDALVDAMIESGLPSLLDQLLTSLEEESEVDKAGVYHIFGVLENLASRASVAELIGENTGIIPWLLSRIQKSPKFVDQNTQYSAEVLAILLQSAATNRARLIDLNGIDIFMQLLNRYSKRNPASDTEEEEYAENIFYCITCCVADGPGKEKFLVGEGIELCLIMIREGKWSRRRALRLLNHALAGPDIAAAAGCEQLVDVGGLKTIFSLFLKKTSSFNTEQLLFILSSMLRSLPADSDARVRLLAKFVEKDYEKITVILHIKSLLEDARKKTAQEEWETLSFEEQEKYGREEWLTRQLNERHYALETLNVVLSWLVAEDKGIREKIKAGLLKQKQSLEDVTASLQAQLKIINESDGSEDPTVKEMLETLVRCL